MMQELFRNDIVTLSQEPGFVRLRRTSKPVGGENAMQIAQDLIDRFRLLIPLRERKTQGLLLDSREAPMVVDDEGMAPLRPVVAEVMSGFPRIAILVRTAVGKLQATRRVREEAGRGPNPRVFDDEAAAIAFLRGEETATPPRSLRSTS